MKKLTKLLALMLVLILALPLAVSASAESGQVVLSVGSAFTTFFNPYFQGTMIGYAYPCYEPLAWLHSLNHEFEAVLAESWEVNKEECSLTIHVRDGVTFSDGDKMDANDVYFTLQSRLDFGTASTSAIPPKWSWSTT